MSEFTLEQIAWIEAAAFDAATRCWERRNEGSPTYGSIPRGYYAHIWYPIFNARIEDLKQESLWNMNNV